VALSVIERKTGFYQKYLKVDSSFLRREGSFGPPFFQKPFFWLFLFTFFPPKPESDFSRFFSETPPNPDLRFDFLFFNKKITTSTIIITPITIPEKISKSVEIGSCNPATVPIGSKTGGATNLFIMFSSIKASASACVRFSF